MVFTGLLDMKRPGEYPYLAMDGTGEGGALCRGRPPGGRLRAEISFGDLPEGCREVVLGVYRRLWGLL